jgi:hypothetical protein
MIDSADVIIFQREIQIRQTSGVSHTWFVSNKENATEISKDSSKLLF